MDATYKAVEHFVNLARQGDSRGASGGQVQARKLALAILELAPGLDAEAIEGAAAFMVRVPISLPYALELINGN